MFCFSALFGSFLGGFSWVEFQFWGGLEEQDDGSSDEVGF